MSTDLHAVLNETSICAKAIKVMVNAFFKKQRKYSTDSVFNDRVVFLALNLVLPSLFWYDEQKLQYDLYFKFCTSLLEMFSQSPRTRSRLFYPIFMALKASF